MAQYGYDPSSDILNASMLNFGPMPIGGMPSSGTSSAPTVPVPTNYSVSPGSPVMGAPPPAKAPGGLSAEQIAFNGRTQVGQAFHNLDGTFDWSAVGSAAQAIGGLGQLYLGFQANKQAKEEFQYMKQITDKNMANQIKDFNKAVEDQSYSRAAQNNAAAGTAEKYIEKHKL